MCTLASRFALLSYDNDVDRGTHGPRQITPVQVVRGPKQCMDNGNKGEAAASRGGLGPSEPPLAREVSELA